MKVRIAQSSLCDPVHGGSRYDATEGARCTEALVIRHNEQHVGRTFRRHDARRPPWCRTPEAFSLITPPNFGSGGGNCLPVIVVVDFG